MIDLINKFKEIQALLLVETPSTYLRDFHHQIQWDARLIGIVGARGVGKTTLLLQHLSNVLTEKDALYLSADSVLLGKTSLFELAQYYHQQLAGSVLIVDEVHRCKNWSAELKTIYDALPSLKVIFSGSSQINILKGRSDLSRRAITYTLNGLSFREFLNLENNLTLPILSLDQILSDHVKIAADLSVRSDILENFEIYLKARYYPFYRETPELSLYYQQIINVLDKSIFEDVAINSNLQTENLLVFKELLVFLSSITPGEINIHKIAKNIGKKDDTIKSYLQILHDTSLLRFLPSALSGHAKLRSAQKIFFDNTNMLNALCYFSGNDALSGLIRETFVVGQLQNSGHKPVFSKVGDIKVQKNIFEIGGASKSGSQLYNEANGYILSADITKGSTNKIPLYLIGFLY